MKLRRLKEGRGFADRDGGGGVYKGKKKNRKNKPTQNLPEVRKPGKKDKPSKKGRGKGKK